MWKQLVLARWPAAAKLNVQDFKRFYRSHHASLVISQGGTYAEIDAAASQDPADIQFIVDMGVCAQNAHVGQGIGLQRRSIVSIVLDGAAARSLDVPAAPGLGHLWAQDQDDESDYDGLGWTVHPNVDEMRGDSAANVPLRSAFRDAFSRDCLLTLTAFRKSDKAMTVLVDKVAFGELEHGFDGPGEPNRVDFDKHAVALTGEMRHYNCIARFGYLVKPDGDDHADPTWVFGFDIRHMDNGEYLPAVDVWKALTLLEWKK